MLCQILSLPHDNIDKGYQKKERKVYETIEQQVADMCMCKLALHCHYYLSENSCESTLMIGDVDITKYL